MARGAPVILLLLGAGCGGVPCGWFGIVCAGGAAGGPVVDRDHDVWPEGEDCDDTRGTVHPGAEERCDGLDNDCDGAVDEGFEGAFRAFSEDRDGDGFGVDGVLAWACAAPPGFAESAGDCDDADPTVWPGAREFCDGRDRDCDGEPAGCGFLADSPLVLRSANGGGLGTAIALADLTGDGLLDLAAGAAGYPVGGEERGAVFVLAGPLTAAGERSLEGPLLTGGLSGARFGHALSADGDLDGDGYTDLVVGAPDADVYGENTGRAYLFLGPLTAARSAAGRDAVVGTSGEGSHVGARVAGVRDLDGDGIADLVVGAPERVGEDGAEGAAFVFFGPLSGERDLGEADLRLEGADFEGVGGAALAAVGDLDGDGFDDLALGVPGWDDWRGRVLVLFGPLAAADAAPEPDRVLEGDEANGLFGRSVAGADLDGDGRAELVVGIPGADAGDGAAVVRGLDDDAPRAWIAGAPGDRGRAGSRVAAGPDLDGDGTPDVVVAARVHDEPGTEEDAGAVWVLYGPLTGTVELGWTDDRLIGAAAGEEAGHALAAGDLDGDGLDDLLVGAPLADGGGGAVYLRLTSASPPPPPR